MKLTKLAILSIITISFGSVSSAASLVTKTDPAVKFQTKILILKEFVY